MAVPQASSRLEMLQARFQQKQLQEKEQKLLQLYDQQQQRAYQVVQRGSAGSNSSHGSTRTSTTATTHATSTSQGGKVRQMFDERRQTTVKGIDRSYPLEPLESKPRKQANVNATVTAQRNGNVTTSRQSVKRVSRADVNSNVNGGKPVVSYHEEIVRERSFGPSFVRRHDDEDEYGVENRGVTAFANGHYRHEIDNEQEEALDQDTIDRNRMMAKIHLMGFDETLKHRVRNDLESEEFPEYLIADVPDKLAKRSVAKKLSRAEERLERFKNANARRSNVPKQATVRKRSEQATKSNSRLRSEIAGSSPISVRSGSSRISERSQRILENAKSSPPFRTHVSGKASARRRDSSKSFETLSQRTSPRSFSSGEATAETTSRFYPRSRNNEFKSLTSDGKIFVRRSPQFFCRESKRSGTTASIDRKSDSSGSPFFLHREPLMKQNGRWSPRFSLNESEHRRRTSESKSPAWSDTGVSSKSSTSPRYFHYESKRSEAAVSTDRETVGSKSYGSEWSERNPRPQLVFSESERSGTTVSIDRKVGEPGSSYDRKILTKRGATPRPLNARTEQRSAATTNIDQKYSGPKSSEITRDRRSTSPQFFCKESEKSATTMLIEPRSRSADSIKSERRNHVSDTSYGQSAESPIDKKISSTKYRRTPSPSFARDEAKEAWNKNKVFGNTAEVRGSSKIAETSSSIVSLKYGLEFDNVLQSAGLVRKFMKSQSGRQRATHQSSSKRNIKDVNARIPTKSRRKMSPPLRTRPPSSEGRKGATPEFPRKAITPTEVDVDIQEIIMTDHRIERDRLQKASSPVSKRQFDRTYTKSTGSRAKFEAPIYPVRKTSNGQGEPILESSAFKGLSERSSADRSDRESEESVGLSKFGPVSESSRIVTRDREDESRMSSRARKQSARDQAKSTAARSAKHEGRRRASSRSPNRMRNRSAESRADGPRATSPDFSRVETCRDAVSPIFADFAKRTKGARAKSDRPRSLRSARIVLQDATKDRHLSMDDEYNRGEEDENVAIDEVDAGIGTKYQTVVETALSKEIEDHRSPNADRIKKIFKTRKPTKSSASKKTISPTRECGRRHDVKTRFSPRVSPSRKAADISRDDAYTPKIYRNIVSKADRGSPKSKFSTTEDRKRESVLVAKKLADSFNEMGVKRKTEELNGGSSKEFSKVLREDKYGKDLGRTGVESTLRRFDPTGAEFEISSPTDLRASPEISLRMIDKVQTKASIEESIASEGTTVPSREVTDHMILRPMLKSPIGRAKSVAHTSDLRILQKETRSPKGSTKVGSSVESKRRSTRTRSPTCKRRLFGSDSERETQEEESKSSRAKARKNENYPFANFRFRKDEAVSRSKPSKGLLAISRDVTRESTRRSEETPTFSVKPLRSIEDIRKSIDKDRSKSVVMEGSRSAIANPREGTGAKRPSPGTDAAKNYVILGAKSPARLITIKSCVSRITKSPSPDLTAAKRRETDARATRRGSAPSSPSKSPEAALRRTVAESRGQEAKPSRKSTIARGADSTRNKATGAADGVVLQNGSPTSNETATKKSDAFTIDFDDRPSREDDGTPVKKSSMKKSSNDKQQIASSASSRPASSSNSSVNLIQDSSAKGRMAESERGKGRGKIKSKGTEKPSSSNGKLANASSFNEDATVDTKGLVKCKTCGRSFAQNRIDLHEDICTRTATKKRKQFDPVMCRVKGTELEPFVKRGLAKRETKKPETRPDWRRKHEEFINAIRYARETQARLAAGGNLSDLPPPPPSDTSDYVQCEHCGRKFNGSAAERHVPICKRVHDKKRTQAPKARR